MRATVLLIAASEVVRIIARVARLQFLNLWSRAAVFSAPLLAPPLSSFLCLLPFLLFLLLWLGDNLPKRIASPKELTTVCAAESGA